ncbi:HNH endonuclease signature motif containing protein [Nocardioides convexus]|uniref:HNH endonuclease signature motif containing protein n=1 Tax=Nocardioides convexus TaxID=2712224 RepID=UPI002418B834|nr:HNH endonuclease signature motif containing protein [Nocardioides convexus]
MSDPIRYEGLRYDARNRVIGASLLDRFTTFVSFDDSGCWLWVGKVNPNGYGAFAVNGKWRYAHRVALALLVEEVPIDLEVDHLCEVRDCVNPDHLEVVTAGTNMRRQGRIGALADQTSCAAGHDMTPDNTYTWRGQRKCRACHRQREATRRAARSSCHA